MSAGTAAMLVHAERPEERSTLQLRAGVVRC